MAEYKVFKLNFKNTASGREYILNVVAKSIKGAERIIRRGHYTDNQNNTLTSYDMYLGPAGIDKDFKLIKGINYETHFVDNYGGTEHSTHEEGYWLEKPYTLEDLAEKMKYDSSYSEALVAAALNFKENK